MKAISILAKRIRRVTGLSKSTALDMAKLVSEEALCELRETFPENYLEKERWQKGFEGDQVFLGKDRVIHGPTGAYYF